MILIYIEPPKIALVFLLPEKINTIVGIGDLIAADFVLKTIQNNNAVIVLIGNCVVFDDITRRKAHPNSVNAVVNVVADDLIACTKAELNRIVNHIVNLIARNN